MRERTMTGKYIILFTEIGNNYCSSRGKALLNLVILSPVIEGSISHLKKSLINS